jgi:putative ABC transport system permease protein
MLVVVGIATGVSLIVAINVINTSVLSNFRQSIDLMAGPAALEITLGVGEIGFPESTVDIVRTDPSIVAAIPLVRGTVALGDDPRETLQLFGVDLTSEDDLARYRLSLDTDRSEILSWLNDPRSIALTATFAQRHGIVTGDRKLLATPRGVESFTIRGLLRPDGLARAFAGALAVMDLPAAQRLLGKDDRIDQIDLVLDERADVGAVRERLQLMLPAGLTVERPAQRGAHYERILGSFQALLLGISTLCLVAGIFIVYNTTSTAAVRRATALAGLQVIGADARTLFRLLMVEAFLLGAIGTIAGVALGGILATTLAPLVTDSMGIIFQLRFPIDRLAPSLTSVTSIAALGIAATLFASFFAARRVASMEPLEVLRSGALSMERSSASSRLLVWWLTLVVSSGAALVAQEWVGSIVLGNFGATLWNGSVIVIAIPLVGWLTGPVVRGLPRLLEAEGQMAGHGLLRSATRTGVTAAAVALVMTIGIMLSSLTVSFRRSMRDYVGRVLAGDLVVSAVSTEGGWLETPLPETLVAELGTIPGVRAVESLRVLPGEMYRGLRIAVGGLSDGFFDAARFPPSWYREGNPVDAARAIRAGTGANISTGLSDRTGLHAGDDIVLDTPTGPIPLRVTGVVPDYASDRGTVIVSRRLIAERWLESGVSRINVTLDDSASSDRVRDSIVERLGDRYRLKILSTSEVLAYHDEMIGRAFAFTDAIHLLVIAVTVAGILDLLLSSIVERRRELALWRVIGADAVAVRRSVIVESVTVGALGASLGVAAGLVTAWIWITINFRHLLGYYLERHFAFISMTWYVVLVIAMTVISGYVAARYATRQDIISGIQDE